MRRTCHPAEHPGEPAPAAESDEVAWPDSAVADTAACPHTGQRVLRMRADQGIAD
ncbi:hypothetical protein VSH64_18120 [Amycolatopsis rhabdoformis]|uniref:Uncharacterized protein n=1 Tax=Amycolatopsis rhabdoformis TaxID=1448059 RepID=A0ABZ1IJ64_9PSEU|nr:hypothetical protein [Amycolatopsis rhabdoformis]WSE33992.1 hypothetical protein VSH64_18120 [Amycolatopsis rhabdoformis]